MIYWGTNYWGSNYYNTRYWGTAGVDFGDIKLYKGAYLGLYAKLYR